MMTNQDKKKILIVDDDENLRVVLRDKLRLLGFEVEESSDGKEGLDKALILHPDVILLDVLMPIMDGWAMLRKLRIDPWGKIVRVIMLTVVEDLHSVARAMEDGSFSYLIKTGESMNDIISKVEDVLKD